MASGTPNSLSTWATTIFIGVLGSVTLIAQHFSTPAAAGPIAVIVPPWRQGGITFAAEVGLPVIDIRWGGRLLILSGTASPLPLSRMGPFVMPAANTFGCVAAIDQTGAT